MPTLLIIDDEPNVLYSLEKTLRTDTLQIVTAQTAGEGTELVRTARPDAVILDVRLPDMSGLDAFVEIRGIDPRLPVIIVTAYATTATAIEAMKRGAFEYLLKPVEFDRLRHVVGRALEVSRMCRVPAVFADERPDDPPDEAAAPDVIVGRSPAMQEIYKAIGRMAPQDVTVLIQGESGTGKELVARAIYQHSRRSGGPFLAINCAAIPDALLESELFGHERGAFTGADARRVGKFEQVDGGTLFLDEIGDMSSAAQAKILRLLQDGGFERVGSNQTLHADVRVIAATNRDLEASIGQGDFRRDLYYRLKVFSVYLPPLRERPEDLPLLVEHFVRVYGREFGRGACSVSPEAMEALRRHDWPGNIRELQSTVKYALVHAVGETITPDCLPRTCFAAAALEQQLASGTDDPLLDGLGRLVDRMLHRREQEIYRKVHSDVDRVLLQRVLGRVDGNQAQAAQLLGISRTTLRARMGDLGLAPSGRSTAESDPAGQRPDNG